MINIFLILFFIIFIVPSILSFVDGNIIQSLVLFCCSLIGLIPLFIINSKRVKIILIFPIVFIIFGLVGIVSYIMNVSIPNKVTTTAEIVELMEAPTTELNEYYPKIKYIANGKTYFKYIKSQFGNFILGEKVIIYYNQKAPEQVNIKPNCLILFIAIGFLFAGIMILFFKLNKKRIR